MKNFGAPLPLAGGGTGAATAAGAILNLGLNPFLADGQCYLQYVSTTQIALVPVDGGNLVINGVQCQVPSAGVTAANAGNASTSYWVYAYMAGSTMTLDLSGTGPTIDAAGRKIKTGDPTRRYVGRYLLDGSGKFVDSTSGRWVISYFNRRIKSSFWTFQATTSSTSMVSLTGGHGILIHGDESIDVASYAYVGLNTSGSTPYAQMQMYLNGAVIPSNGSAFGNILNQYTNVPCIARAFTLQAEGPYTLDTYGSTSGGNVTYTGTMMCLQRG